MALKVSQLGPKGLVLRFQGDRGAAALDPKGTYGQPHRPMISIRQKNVRKKACP